MINFKPSASSLDRTFKCRASAIIPIRLSSENEAASRGTALHKYIEYIIEGKTPEAALLYIEEEYQEACRRTDVSFLTGLHDTQSEVSYAVDFESGAARYLGQGLNRNYEGIGESEFTGTLDIHAKRNNKAVLIDLKSGMLTTEAAKNYQIKFAAYALHKVHGYDTVDSYLMYLREGDENIPDYHRFTDFDSIRQEFQSFYRLLVKEQEEYTNQGKLDLQMGSHCEFCPAAVACPAMTNYIRTFAEKAGAISDFDKVTTSVARLSEEQLASAWQNYMKAKNYFDVAEKALRARVRKKGIRAATFKVTPTECERTKLDPNKLLKLAKDLGANSIAIDKCFSKTQFTRLRETAIDNTKTDNNKDNKEEKKE